jgi:hypothetical protein
METESTGAFTTLTVTDVESLEDGLETNTVKV